MNVNKRPLGPVLFLVVTMFIISGMSSTSCASQSKTSSSVSSQTGSDIDAVDGIAKTEENNSSNASAEHMYIFNDDGDCVPLSIDIDSFEEKMNVVYYDKDEDACFYAYFSPMHVYYLVYYDKDTRKVWKVIEYTDLLALTSEMEYDDFDYSDESIAQLYQESKVRDYFINRYTKKYHKSLESYSSTKECIDMEVGMVIFEMDKDLGPVAVTVDKSNSNGYKNLEDSRYGFEASKLKIEDFYPAID